MEVPRDEYGPLHIYHANRHNALNPGGNRSRYDINGIYRHRVYRNGEDDYGPLHLFALHRDPRFNPGEIYSMYNADLSVKLPNQMQIYNPELEANNLLAFAEQQRGLAEEEFDENRRRAEIEENQIRQQLLRDIITHTPFKPWKPECDKHPLPVCPITQMPIKHGRGINVQGICYDGPAFVNWYVTEPGNRESPIMIPYTEADRAHIHHYIKVIGVDSNLFGGKKQKKHAKRKTRNRKIRKSRKSKK